MTEDEYDKKLEDIKLESNKKELTLARDYAFSNNTIEAGDIVEDHIGLVKVENVRFRINSISTLRPHCVYEGPVLRVDMEPRKDGIRRSVYQDLIIASTRL